MDKREAIDRLNRLLLVAEGLPENTSVISVRLDDIGSAVHLREGSGVAFDTRRQVSLEHIESSVMVSGVKLFERIDAPLPENV
jgi:hypothetical protein